MENKYYTPSIEEFHVGFEYETYSDQKGWEPKVYGLLDFIDWGYDGNYICVGSVRVKYLDQSDIEELGWIKNDRPLSHEWELGEWRLMFYRARPDANVRLYKCGITPGTFRENIYLDIKNKSALKQVMEMVGVSND